MRTQATSYLVTAWEALAAQQETTMDELPVTFEDVSIVQAVQAQPGENVTLSVTLDRSHRFQVPSPFFRGTESTACPALHVNLDPPQLAELVSLALPFIFPVHMNVGVDMEWQRALLCIPSSTISRAVADCSAPHLQVLQETDIIAEGRIKARAAPNAPKKEADTTDESAEAPGDTVAPPAEAAAMAAAPAPAAEAPKAESVAAEGELPPGCNTEHRLCHWRLSYFDLRMPFITRPSLLPLLLP